MIAFIFGLYKLATAHTFPDKISEMPLLTKAYVQSDLPARLTDLSIRYFEVECGSWSKKTQGTIHFVDKEHRRPLEVNGSQSCGQSGALFSMTPESIRAKENFKPELVFAEINDLLAKKNTGNRFNTELAHQLQAQFSDLAQKREVPSVFFHCDEPGQPYSFVYYKNGGRYKVSETLKTTCKVAHQNFDVDMESDPVAVHFTVHEYNAVDAATVTAVYAEFLGAGPTKSMF